VGKKKEMTEKRKRMIIMASEIAQEANQQRHFT
jgi:hypothetical protein